LTNLQELQERLKKGFYLDNLYEMARICRNLALDTASPAPLFVMRNIFLDIARHWEDKPLLVEDAKLVEEKMTEPLVDLVEGIEAATSSEEVLNLLNRVVSAYLIAFM